MRHFAALLAALSLCGCFAFDPVGMDPIDLDWGAIAVTSIEVEPVDAGLHEVAARVRLTVKLVEASAPSLNVSLDDEGCSDVGPPSTPTSPVQRVSLALPDDRRDQTIAFDEVLRGPASIGIEGSVFVWVEAQNAIGPIFGSCDEFVRHVREPKANG